MGGGNLKHFLLPASAIVDQGFSKGLKTLVAPASALMDKKAGSAGGGVDSAPVPTPGNPISAANAAVLQAEHDFAAQNMLKKGINKTIIAGDTGGWSQQSPRGSSGPGSGYKAKQG